MEKICERSEELGWIIQEEIDNTSLDAVKIPRKNHIKPLDSFRNTVKINQVEVYVNTTVLFTRLADVAKREVNKEDYFDYELTIEPTALFKNGMMRKPDKPSLRKALLKDKDITGIDQMKHDCLFVLDDGVASSMLDQGNVVFRDRESVRGLRQEALWRRNCGV